MRCVATVDRQSDASHQARRGTGEPQHCGGDLLGPAEAADGLVGDGVGDAELALAIMSVTIGVSMVPGQIALIRIPRGAYSRRHFG